MSTPILVGSLQDIQKSWIPTCTVVTLTQLSRSKVKFEKLSASIHAMSISYIPLVIALLLSAYIWLEGVQYLRPKFLALWSSFLQLAPQKGVFYPSLSKTTALSKNSLLGTKQPHSNFLGWKGWGFWGANHLINMC